MTTLNGTFTSCGPGQDFGYQFVCNGPSCDELADFPGTICTSDPTSNTLICNNGVTCPSPSNYTASFNLSQATTLVSLSQLIVLPDFCEDITVTSTGTTGGVNASLIVTGPCGPSGNGTLSSSSSSVSPSTSTLPSSSFTGLSSFSFSNTTSSGIPTTLAKSTSSGSSSPGKTSTTLTTTTYTSNGSHSSGGSSTTTSHGISASSTKASSTASGSKTSSSASSPATPATSGHASNTVSGSKSSSAAVSPIVTVTTEVVTAYTTYCPAATTFTEGASTYTVTAPTTLTITNCPCTLTHVLTGSIPISSTSATSSLGSPASGGSPSNGENSHGSGASVGSGSSGSNGSGSIASGDNGSNTSGEKTSSFAAPGASTATKASSSASTVASISPSTSVKPNTVIQSSSASSMRSGFKLSPSRLIRIFLSLIFFMGSTLASSVHLDSDTNLNLADEDTTMIKNNPPAKWISSDAINTTHLDLIKRESTPGWKTFADLVGEYLGGKLVTPGFAENLVAELEEAVCDHAVGVLITKALGVDLVEACVGAIDVAGGLAALGTLQPEIEFLAVLESSILCNALVAAALPGIGEITDAICKEEKPCSENLLTDVNNCGQCNNTCIAGQSCVNGACTSGACTGQTCSTFGPCGPGGTCVCASTSEDTGYCVDGSTACDGLPTCDTSLDCASGEICAVATCCEVNVCVGATFCGGSDGGDLTARGMLKRAWANSTIASQGDWIPEFF